MQSTNRYDGVHPRAVQFIRFHARQLASSCAVPGMEIVDYEQVLVIDLLERSERFDSSRSSYATFADRLVRNRVASLFESGARIRRAWADEEDGNALANAASETGGQWLRSTLPSHETVSLRLDLERFIERLPSRLQRCCDWLVAESRRTTASAIGLHRSSLYDAASELKERARAAGLDRYL